MSSLIFFAWQLKAVLVPGYFISLNGDTVFGNMEVKYLKDIPDSIFLYELQYGALFASKNGKVLALHPGKHIKEVAIKSKNTWIKMICVPRKEYCGNHKLKRYRYIFAVRVLNGPLEVYELFIKRFWGFMEYESDYCFHRKGTSKKVRECMFKSEKQFRFLVEDCDEAVYWLKRNGILTQSHMMDLVFRYNKYCAN